MAGRIRSLKPELMEDEATASLSHVAFRLFVGMILIADDHGNLRASRAWLKGQVFHHAEITDRAFDSALAELTKKLVTIYVVGEQRYAHVNGWAKHQRIDNAMAPRVPLPPGWECVEEVRSEGNRTRRRWVSRGVVGAAPPAPPPASGAAPQVHHPDDGAARRAREVPPDPDLRSPISDLRPPRGGAAPPPADPPPTPLGTMEFDPSTVRRLSGDAATILDAIDVPELSDICARSGGAEALAKTLAAGAMLAKRRPGAEGADVLARAARGACVQTLGEVANGKHPEPKPLANVVRGIFGRLLANPEDLAGMQGASRFAREAQESALVEDSNESRSRLIAEGERDRARAEEERRKRDEWLAGEGKNRKQPNFGEPPVHADEKKAGAA